MYQIKHTTNNVSGLGEYKGWFVTKRGVCMNFKPFETKEEAENEAQRLVEDDAWNAANRD